MTKKLKRTNGIVTETAHLKGGDKFRENFDSVFGERVKTICLSCGLSSKQKIGEDFCCPHCETEHYYHVGIGGYLKYVECVDLVRRS